ncbi:MAG: EamA family transporter [Salinibacterium sp.]|nr:EamA family transporter [Salinibacterium sp.]
MIVALLVGGAALAHAIWNITIKRAGTSGAGFLWLTFLVGSIVFAPFGIASLRDVDLTRWLPLILVSGALQVAYFLLLQRAYRLGDVSLVYPLARGTGPLLAVLLAIVILGERPTPIALVGAGVVIAGVVIIGFAGGRAAAVVNRAGVVYGLLVGVVIAAFTLWDASAVTVGGMPPVGLYWGSVLVQMLLLATPALRRVRDTRAIAGTHWRAVLTVGILSPLAYILILLAMQLAPVSTVAPAREVSVVLVGLAGWLIFREPNPVQRLVGAGVVLAGVALLAL